MPIYEYICEGCQTHFEKIVLNKTQEIACPKCAGKKNAIQLSVFSAANGSSNGTSAKIIRRALRRWRQLLWRRLRLSLRLHVH
jgi:putative FmdB family regulatory protein